MKYQCNRITHVKQKIVTKKLTLHEKIVALENVD